jgi:WD40 repeat protein
MQLLTLAQRKKRTVSALAFAPDGRALVASSVLSVPTLWELPVVGAPVPLSNVPIPPSSAFTFSPDARVVGWICGPRRFERDRGTPEARAAKLTPETEALVSQATCGADQKLLVRTTNRGTGYRIRAFTPDGKDGWAEAWTVGPADDLNGRSIVGASRADRFFTWEILPFNQGYTKRVVMRSTLTGEMVDATTVGLSYILGLAVAPDASMAIFFRNSSLHAWRPGGKVEKVRTGTLTHYRALAFHPDGRHLLAGNNDTTARLIDTQTWQVVRQFVWDIGVLTAVAVSPDGALAAAGGAKGRIVVWDLDI